MQYIFSFDDIIRFVNATIYIVYIVLSSKQK